MKGITLATLMTVGILVFAATAIGLSYAKYDEATTTVVLEDGIACTINGKEVSSGETVTVRTEGGYLNVCAKSPSPAIIGYSGQWTSGDRTSTATKWTDKEVEEYDFKIALNHGSYTGRMTIKNMDGDELQPIDIKFTIDESKVTVTHGSTVVHDGDVVTLVGDDAFQAATVDGQKHTIRWDGHWSNPDGESSGTSGCHYTASTTITVQDFIYFSKATGTMTVSVSD